MVLMTGMPLERCVRRLWGDANSWLGSHKNNRRTDIHHSLPLPSTQWAQWAQRTGGLDCSVCGSDVVRCRSRPQPLAQEVETCPRAVVTCRPTSLHPHTSFPMLMLSLSLNSSESRKGIGTFVRWPGLRWPGPPSFFRRSVCTLHHHAKLLTDLVHSVA